MGLGMLRARSLFRRQGAEPGIAAAIVRSTAEDGPSVPIHLRPSKKAPPPARTPTGKPSEAARQPAALTVRPGRADLAREQIAPL